MVAVQKKVIDRLRRRHRIRKVVNGTKTRPRLSVFRSLRHLYIQAIDDQKGETIFSVSDKEIGNKKNNCIIEIAGKVGESAAKKAKEKGIKEIVFDRGGYRYHGRVKAVADGMRKEGIKF
ncbi:50S ribosomal protein L18 [Patescibacteria group bacterium]